MSVEFKYLTEKLNESFTFIIYYRDLLIDPVICPIMLAHFFYNVELNLVFQRDSAFKKGDKEAFCYEQIYNLAFNKQIEIIDNKLDTYMSLWASDWFGEENNQKRILFRGDYAR